eukprot:TRINITY_DN2258_c0_g3_i1.p1 TRINITY_DN2258_c0_g3~~TRINITY_DN2258_c0_g3_i1.p1  ORF type:complete len:496 (+),score=166.09 TRINITY_DN2258_c0_g3_i1:155-1642(+)
MHVENRGMSMMLLSLPIWAFAIIFGAFSALLAASIVIGGFGPTVWREVETDAWQCPDPDAIVFDANNCTGIDMSLNDTQFVAQLSGFSKLNQEIDLYVRLQNLRKDTGLERDVRFVLSIFGSEYESGKDWQSVLSEDSKTVKRTIKCTKGKMWCTEAFLFKVGFVTYRTYEFVVSTPELKEEGSFGNMQFTFNYVNPHNTKFELWWRVFFLVVGFVALAVIFFFLRKFKFFDWTIEQKWTVILLFALIGYNNPFWPLQILGKSGFWTFWNQVLTVTFLAVLLLYWLVTFDGLRKESQNHTFLWFYVPKFVFIFVIWGLVIALFTWNQLYSSNDPTHSYADELGGYIFLAIAALVLLVAYLFWVGYYLFRAMVESKGVSFLGTRIKFFGGFTIFVMLAVIALAVISFLSPPFVDNNAAKFLTTISLANLYVYVLTVVFIPARDAHPDQWKQDNRANVSEAFPPEKFEQVVDDPVSAVHGDDNAAAEEQHDGDENQQ